MIKIKKETIQRMKPFFSNLRGVIEVLEHKVNEREHIFEFGYFKYGGMYFYPSDFEDETTMKTEFKRGVDEIPEHYKKACGTIEPRQFLKMMPFQLGNACKYILRCSYKGAERQDLMKALDYLEWADDDGEKPFNPAVYYLAPFFANDIIDALFEANGEVNYNGARNLISSLLERVRIMATNEEIADALDDAGCFPKHISMMILDDYPINEIFEEIDKLHNFTADELKEGKEVCKKISLICQIYSLAFTRLEHKHEN